jgi:hypothetical protein
MLYSSVCKHSVFIYLLAHNHVHMQLVYIVLMEVPNLFPSTCTSVLVLLPTEL